MTPQAHGWLAPRLASRTGSAHLRRGTPCQDACGWQQLRDREGEPVQLLVVSDGHGGVRHRRSDVGSRLACAVALEEAARGLAAAACGGAIDTWSAWLAHELPQRIVATWRKRVEAHWRHHPPGAAQGFSSVPYGATLGVLVLTPRWWGHTGLGDWDLVRLAGGAAELLDEEPAEAGDGEATFSLCMENAARHFAPRSGLQPLSPTDPPFQLLLSTDGIRKSCDSDTDFLTLSRHLAALPAAPQPQDDPELAAGLDHISREGSGDDVSVVIGRWGPCGAMALPAAGPLILQPAPPAPEPPNPEPQKQSARPPLPPVRFGGPSQLLVMVVLLMAAAASGAGLAAWWLRLGPFAPAPPLLTAEQQAAIGRQVATLCAGRAAAAGRDRQRLARIGAALQQRKTLFTQLAGATPAGQQAALSGDPLTALIALSRLAPEALVVPGESSASALPPPPDRALPMCADLREALTARWAALRPAPPGPGPSVTPGLRPVLPAPPIPRQERLR